MSAVVQLAARSQMIGWIAAEHASLLKVRVLRHNRKLSFSGVLPDSIIVRAPQSTLVYMRRTWIDVGQQPDQARREVFVKQKLRGQITNRPYPA